jgi:hypothetical protein
MRGLTKLVCGLAMATAACGGTQGSVFEAQEGNLSYGTLPPLQSFARWDGRTPFVPSFKDAQSFVTQLTASPYDRTRFRAYGVDATTGIIYFQIDVSSAELPSFLAEIGKEIGAQTVSATQAGLTSYTWGSTGQIIIRAPPDPNPPTPGGLPVLVSQILNLGTTVYKSIVTSESAY